MTADPQAVKTDYTDVRPYPPAGIIPFFFSKLLAIHPSFPLSFVGEHPLAVEAGKYFEPVVGPWRKVNIFVAALLKNLCMYRSHHRNNKINVGNV